MSTPSPAGAPLRNRPQQARSRARLESVLAAADRLLIREGADALTTTRVAAEAGVSVGSLYHYLPDRDAILHSLALGYLAGFEAQMELFVQAAPNLEWDGLVEAVIDAYADAFRRQAGYRALWFGRHLSEQTRAADRAHNQTMAAGLRKTLLAMGVADSDQLPTMCLAAQLTADALMVEAFRDDPAGNEAMLTECKRMVRSYIDSAGLKPARS
ncbi:MAG: TetR/AcrR family transcriptional regulator [Mycobacterium sp.]|nr:TetR/AcrR family transcriptional regulator [Mycobacterium sp.]